MSDSDKEDLKLPKKRSEGFKNPMHRSHMPKLPRGSVKKSWMHDGLLAETERLNAELAKKGDAARGEDDVPSR